MLCNCFLDSYKIYTAKKYYLLTWTNTPKEWKTKNNPKQYFTASWLVYCWGLRMQSFNPTQNKSVICRSLGYYAINGQGFFPLNKCQNYSKNFTMGCAAWTIFVTLPWQSFSLLMLYSLFHGQLLLSCSLPVQSVSIFCRTFIRPDWQPLLSYSLLSTIWLGNSGSWLEHHILQQACARRKWKS